MSIRSSCRFFAFCLALPAGAPLLAQTVPDSYLAGAAAHDGTVSRLSQGEIPGFMPEADATALYGQTLTISPARDGIIPTVLGMGAELLANDRLFAGAEFGAGTPSGPRFGLSVGLNF